jgi:uncharacterized protein with HEPN domain
MQPGIKNDLLYLLGILESIGKINRYVAPCTTADEFYFFNEQMNFNASLNLLAHIGELCAKTSTELKEKYPHINWQKAKDFRNRIVHDYAGLNIYIVHTIIVTDLPFLQKDIEKIIQIELSQSIFDSEEVTIARNSTFYSHIDFSTFDL